MISLEDLAKRSRRTIVAAIAAVALVVSVTTAVSWWMRRPPLNPRDIGVKINVVPVDTSQLPAIGRALKISDLERIAGERTSGQFFVVDIAITVTTSNASKGSVDLVILDKKSGTTAELYAGPNVSATSLTMDPAPEPWLEQLSLSYSDPMVNQTIRVGSARTKSVQVVAHFHGDAPVSTTDITAGLLYFGPSGRYQWAKEA